MTKQKTIPLTEKEKEIIRELSIHLETEWEIINNLYELYEEELAKIGPTIEYLVDHIDSQLPSYPKGEYDYLMNIKHDEDGIKEATKDWKILRKAAKSKLLFPREIICAEAFRESIKLHLDQMSKYCNKLQAFGMHQDPPFNLRKEFKEKNHKWDHESTFEDISMIFQSIEMQHDFSPEDLDEELPI